jgi:pilus assembly protein Flp/PilA
LSFRHYTLPEVSPFVTPVFPKEFSMQFAISRVKNFLVSEDGPTAVEYAVMLALILVACITIISTLGQSISGTFSKVNSSLGSGS